MSDEKYTAIIVPFRESDSVNKTRTKQLNRFTAFMADYLKGHKYHIIVIEQSDDNRKFNRGMLLNIGFEYAYTSDFGFTNYVFHDVDLLPSEELKEYYIETPGKNPVHIAAVWDRYNSNPRYFGGIVAFRGDIFDKVNGYPNNFWGWGGEDDELYARVVRKKLEIKKPTKGSILDMEQMTVAQKLDYLNAHDAKFMQKREALAKHEETWKHNGVNHLSFQEIGHSSCGDNCVKYLMILDDVEKDLATQAKAMTPEGEAAVAPQELFVHETQQVPQVEEDKRSTPSQAFDKLVQLFFGNVTKNNYSRASHELEVRFGTKGIKPLTKNDYDNVVKVLKSFGFQTSNPDGLSALRVKCEFLDSTTGRFKMSDIRTEINGLTAIEKFCRSNDVKTVYKEEPQSVQFIHKRPYINEEKQMVRPVNMDDFNFRLSYSTEESAKKGLENFVLENWRKSKKEFRYLNRVTFTHPDYPVLVDISITKSGNMERDRRGFNRIAPVYTLEESHVLTNKEVYEIEIEVDNKRLTGHTPESLATALRKVIKHVLSGLQGTLFPISYPEQEGVLRDYMRLVWGEDVDMSRRITGANFLGPNSITLQLINVAPIDDNTIAPNIRKDFVVTEKADGERHMMYISAQGKIYLISTNMDVKFTGAKTLNPDCYNTLLDGELISRDKNGEFINLYAVFDIYVYKSKDVRAFTFVPKADEHDVFKSRYPLLERVVSMINPISILDKGSTATQAPKKGEAIVLPSSLSPIRIEVKKFFPMSPKQTIFEGCRLILEREKQGLFEYEIDGLIFTHAHFGVGSTTVGKAGPKTKITWEHSFKWKPPQYNTIDFLVTTVKASNGDDVVHALYEEGVSTDSVVQFSQYKVLELRCGFSEKNDGFINPCQDLIDDNLPEYKPRFEEKQTNDYVPQRFYPTEPYDPNAGLCKLMLQSDDSGGLKMFTMNHELITDNSIVEFAYDVDGPEGWRWKPLRVRYDKTAKLLRGEREYGNSYKVCNENWKSIHPSGRITEDMLMTGENIPEVIVSEDVYYNTPSGKLKTEGLKNFHNLYVKKLLIVGASKQGDSLIDFACGKAGDLPKWIAAKLSFVFGVDLSPDNLENRLDGACARYLNTKRTTKHMPYALFVNGNSALNIKDGSAMRNDRAKQTTAAVFGRGPKDPAVIGKGVAKQYGAANNGFNVASCQFAIHYFFENPDLLMGFLRNVVECTKLNGYFIGTSYDGKTLFNELRRKQQGESVQLYDGDRKIWEVVKEYSSDEFEDNASSIGYKINVYQESIHQYISEYLVNYDYFDRLMDAHGFKLISKEEATEMGLPAGTGLFSELFAHMMDEIQRNRFKASMFGEAHKMTSYEKKVSFLNRYFVYKKVREVNLDRLHLDLGEYNDAPVEEEVATRRAVEVAREEARELEEARADEAVKKVRKPRAKKLDKKIELVPATEAVDAPLPAEDVLRAMDDYQPPQAAEPLAEPKEAVEPKKRTRKTSPKAKKAIVIEDEEPANPVAKASPKGRKKKAVAVPVPVDDEEVVVAVAPKKRTRKAKEVPAPGEPAPAPKKRTRKARDPDAPPVRRRNPQKFMVDEEEVYVEENY